MRVIEFWHDENGATVIEHAIVVCVMALVIVYAVGSGLSPAEALRRIEILSEVVFTSEPDAQTSDPRAVPSERNRMTVEQNTP